MTQGYVNGIPIDTDATMAANSNQLVPSQAAVVAYTANNYVTGTTTQYNVIVGNGTRTVTAVGPGTAGQVLQSGGNAANPAYSTATYPSTAGTSGNVLTSDGTNWTSAAPTSGSISWTDVTGTSQSAAVNNGYTANNAGLVTITLPATAAYGSIVHVVGKGAGLWKLTANTGQTIKFGDQTTTSAGSITATLQYDAIQVLCTVANTTWTCTGVSQGNLTIS